MKRRCFLLYYISIFLLLTGFLCSTKSFGQERCGSQHFHEIQERLFKRKMGPEGFERWMREKQTIRRQTNSADLRSLSEPVVHTIPVVVHVIHNGEAVGVGRNISDEQILSQIQVLNEDFRRKNADSVNTPDVFKPIAGDAGIEFVMALQDPEGVATDGIVRVDGDREEWKITENYELKNLSAWPSEDYLNIYVIDIEGFFVGYAQFPVSDLDGLEEASENPFTDGIVVDYRAFGSKAIYPEADLISNYQLGRTTTHEVGHYLGLRHIWGDDDNCGIDDFVTDTPPQSTSSANIGEPCSFPGPNTCNSGTGDLPDMIQNYMDYTNDECLNIFTLGQIERIQIVMENSPRRASLMNSPGLQAPVVVSNDAGIRNIVSPEAFACSDPFAPVIEIRNYGDNPISTVEIATHIDEQEQDRTSFVVEIEPGEITTLALPEVIIQNDGIISFEITSVNGAADNNPANNLREQQYLLSSQTVSSFRLDFNELPADWIIVNPDGQITWEQQRATSTSSRNQALGIDFFNYTNPGEIDLFVSPVIDLTDAASAQLTFDVSYAGDGGFSNGGEGLMVTITDDCQSPLFAADTIYYKTTDELRTTNASAALPYRPFEAADWRTEVVNLLPYVGRKIRLSFNAINGWGNNLFIDNIALDLGNSLSITSPDYIFCESDIPLGLRLANSFNEVINSFDIEVNIDRRSQTVFNWTGSLLPNESIDLEALLEPLDGGFHLIEVDIVNVNNGALSFGSDGFARRRIHVNDNQVNTPFRQDFESYQFTDPDAWVTVSQNNTVGLLLESTGSGISIGIRNQQNNAIGDIDVMASPIFSLTDINQAFLEFDLAYKQFNNFGDRLDVKLSRNCGLTYDELIYSRIGDDWPSIDFGGQDIPISPDDWERITLDLNAYLGENDLRLGFFITNVNGGAMYFDNFEFFVSQPVIAENGTIFPNPVGKDGFTNVTFNTDTPQDVEIRVINTMGQVVATEKYSNILNQTLPVDMSNLLPGVYIIQVTGQTFSFSKRVLNGIF